MIKIIISVLYLHHHQLQHYLHLRLQPGLLGSHEVKFVSNLRTISHNSSGKEKAFIISHIKGAAKAVVMSLDDDGIMKYFLGANINLHSVYVEKIIAEIIFAECTSWPGRVVPSVASVAGVEPEHVPHHLPWQEVTHAPGVTRRINGAGACYCSLPP